MNAAALLDRLVEPYLVLDRALQPVAANAAWHARFGSAAASTDEEQGRRPQLDATHRALIQTIAGVACDGQRRLSSVARLETRGEGEGFSSLRDWRVVASFLPPTPTDGAAVILRYDDATPFYPEATPVACESSVSRMVSSMDTFIASVSHEMRSPLNAIVSWAEVLQLAAKPEHVARAGEAIRRNGRQLAHMVDDLLDSGAIATGKLSVKLEPTDLGAIAAIVAEDLAKLAQQKNLRLHASDIAPCIVMADESRMKQVLWNLLTNAVKFTDAGEIGLSVKAVSGHAELEVRDSGRGIDAEALSMVFDRFQQILPQSSGRVGGLGLGLWLAKHIVALHGGTIEAASEGRGKGAVFKVRLPLASPPIS